MPKRLLNWPSLEKICITQSTPKKTFQQENKDQVCHAFNFQSSPKLQLSNAHQSVRQTLRPHLNSFEACVEELLYSAVKMYLPPYKFIVFAVLSQ